MSNAMTVSDSGKQLDLFRPEATDLPIAGDIVIPRLLCMQGLSEFIANRKKSPDGKALAQGDIVRSTTLEILGDPEHPVEVIPLKLTNEWRIEEMVKDKYEFRSREPRTAANDSLPWEFTEKGTKWRRTKVINLFGILAEDIKKYAAAVKSAAETGELPDMNTALLPVMVSFRVMSYQAGKGMATYFAQVEDMKRHAPQVVPYGHSVSLTVKQMTNAKGSFYVFEKGRATKQPAEVVAEAKRWFEMLHNTTAIRVDETGEDAPVEGESDNGPQVC